MLVGVCGFWWDLLGGKKVNLEVFRNKMIKYFKYLCCGNKWLFWMFRKYLYNKCYFWLLIELFCFIWNVIEKFCIWKVIKNFGMKVCLLIVLSNLKSFFVCFLIISYICIFLCVVSWIVKVCFLFMWFFVIWFNF